jgi:hypothetical protein
MSGGLKKKELRTEDDLTLKQKKFVEILVSKWGEITKAEALKQAGYECKEEKYYSDIASKLTSRKHSPHVVKYLDKKLEKAAAVYESNETLLERRLKLYRPLSAITDPRSLVPDFSFSFPVHWPTFREACWDLLQRPHASDALARFDTEAWAQDNGKKNSLDELELSRS